MIQLLAQSANVVANPLFQLIGTIGLGAVLAQAVSAYLAKRTERRRHAQETEWLARATTEPLFQAADELAGRVNELAKTDFKGFHPLEFGADVQRDIESVSLFYTYANFLAQIALLRRARLLSHMELPSRYGELSTWIMAFEGSDVRLADFFRARYIGEAVASNKYGDPASIRQFLGMLQEDKQFQKYISEINPPTTRKLGERQSDFKRRKRAWRQRVLVNGVLAIALCEKFDSSHSYTKMRRIHANKLSMKSRAVVKSILRRYSLVPADVAAKYYDFDGRYSTGLKAGRQPDGVRPTVS